MPEYYEGMPADMWFRLLDIRDIVSENTPAEIAEQKQLRNKRYNDRPVSLYGGMVDLPLFVTREREKSWFADRQALLDGDLWAERETQNRGETERMMRELRDNLHTKRSRDGKAVGGSQERALPRRLQQPAA